jgi:myo-inositol 2-dehydrogenase / D-chiro-inositol 1-dehydrogenase
MNEKPFALNAADAKEMADLAAQTGLTAMITHEFRFASAPTYVKELIDEGYLGTPKFALVRLLRGPVEPSTAKPPEYNPENVW